MLLKVITNHMMIMMMQTLQLPNTNVLFIIAAPTRVLKDIVMEDGVFLRE